MRECGVVSNYRYRALQCTKNSLTITGRSNAPDKLLDLLEQLLHHIKAKRQREINCHYEKFEPLKF